MCFVTGNEVSLIILKHEAAKDMSLRALIDSRASNKVLWRHSLDDSMLQLTERETLQRGDGMPRDKRIRNSDETRGGNYLYT